MQDFIGFPCRVKFIGEACGSERDPQVPLIPGPLDLEITDMSYTTLSHDFDLASPSAVFAYVVRYEGDPVVSVTHGGEPLTIVHDSRLGGVMVLVAYGNGLSVESAPLTITATGGTLGVGALRVSEFESLEEPPHGWIGTERRTDGYGIPLATTGTPSGHLRYAYGHEGPYGSRVPLDKQHDADFLRARGHSDARRHRVP